MRDDTVLASVRVDTLFLDTTYCLPRYTFPSQEDAVAAMAEVRRRAAGLAAAAGRCFSGPGCNARRAARRRLPRQRGPQPSLFWTPPTPAHPHP
jgi:hypothetical protein